LIIDKGHVEFEAATMDSEASHFVTLHLIALEGVAADFEAPNNVPAEWAAATATPASARPGRLRRLLSA
jgi:hypothetical protein